MTDRTAPRIPGMRRLGIALAVAMLAGACGRDENPTATDAENRDPIRTETFEVSVDARWINTGIPLTPGHLIVIEATTRRGGLAAGSPVPDPRGPLPLYGRDGLIGRISSTGFPFPLARERRLQGSTLHQESTLYLGRNTAPPAAFEGGASTEPTDAAMVELPYTPEDYVVTIRVYATDAPAPLTPIDGFYDSSPNPVFDWDELDNASQYNLEISDFPDFRRVLFSVNVNTTSLNTAVIGIDPSNPTVIDGGPNLQEGVYWWRVRAQINKGRLLSPVLVWTDRSVAYRIGIETLAQLPAPRLLTPEGNVNVPTGSVVPFEVLAPDDASGVRYRYSFYTAPCGEIINPDGGGAAELRSPWLVFQQGYQSNRIDEPRRLYAAFPSPRLGEGTWLLRVETRDGADTGATRTGVLDYEFAAGCS